MLFDCRRSIVVDGIIHATSLSASSTHLVLSSSAAKSFGPTFEEARRLLLPPPTSLQPSNSLSQMADKEVRKRKWDEPAEGGVVKVAKLEGAEEEVKPVVDSKDALEAAGELGRSDQDRTLATRSFGGVDERLQGGGARE